uniref:Uncharacterized protein n=1 Tax=Alexandrium monilatum TaxID=311494 RepID=A0A7S4PXS4_9DINO
MAPLRFTPPPLGEWPSTAGFMPESPITRYGTRSPPPFAWAPMEPVSQASSEVSLPGVQAVPNFSRPVSPMPLASRVTSEVRLGASARAFSAFSRSVSPLSSSHKMPHLLSPASSMASAIPQYSFKAAPYASVGSNSPMPPPPVPPSAGPQLSPRGAFKFYGPNDVVNDPVFQNPSFRLGGSFGSTGLGISSIAPPENPRERLVTEDTTVQMEPTGGLPSPILDFSQNSVVSNEYGPPPPSVPQPQGMVRDSTVLVEEAALRDLRLDGQLEDVNQLRGQGLPELGQSQGGEDVNQLRGQGLPERGQSQASWSIPPPPPDAPPSMEVLAASQSHGPGGYDLPPVAISSFQQPRSPGSFRQPSPSPTASLVPAPIGTQQGLSPRSLQAVAEPRQRVFADRHQALERRMRNLGYHSNMDALNQVSTRARNLHTQLRAKSPDRRSLRACC